MTEQMTLLPDEPDPPKPKVERGVPSRSMVEMWVIRFDTPEAPGLFIVRRHFLFHGTKHAPKGASQEDHHAKCETLEEARTHVPMGLFRFVPKDDVVTKEMWI
jgi:hypothetical protein